MDKKAKKKLEVLRKRTQTLQQRIIDTREQEDEPGEVAALEEQLRQTHEEIEKLKAQK
jgi:hypothetical protein